MRRAAYLLAPLAAFALRRALSERLLGRRYDVVHAHWLVPNAVLVADIVRAHGVPLVVSLHGSDVFVAERLRPARLLARRALRRAGAVTACSEDLRRRALALGAPAARTRHRALRRGRARVRAPAARARAAARAWAWREDAFLVLAFGRLVEKKGFAYLVEAAARTGGVHVVIAGEGDLRDGAGAARAGPRGAGAPGGRARRATTSRPPWRRPTWWWCPRWSTAPATWTGCPTRCWRAWPPGRAVVATRPAASRTS